MLFSVGLCSPGSPFTKKHKIKGFLCSVLKSFYLGNCVFSCGGRGSPPCLPPLGVRVLRSLRGDEGRHSRPLEDAWRPPEAFWGFCAAAAARLSMGCKGLFELLPLSKAFQARQPQGLPSVRTAHNVFKATAFCAPLPDIFNKM